MDIKYYPDLERSVLGTSLICKNSAYRIMQALKEDHFNDHKNRIMFSLMSQIYKSGAEITTQSIRVLLEKDGKLAEYAELLATMPYEGSKTDLEFNIGQIKDSYHKTKIAHMIKILSQDLQNQKMHEILQYCFDAINETTDKVTYSVSDLLHDFDEGSTYEQVLDQRIKNYKSGKTIRGYSTGIDVLDHAISGLVKGSYNIIAGTPGSGKTTLAAQMIHKLIKSKKRVGVITLEMSNSEIFDKLQSIEHDIPYGKIANGHINEIEKTQLVNFSRYLKQSNTLFMEDIEITGVSSVTARIKRLVEIYDIDVLCIDYIGLIGLAPGNATISDKIKEISQTIRLLLKKYRIPGIILSQLVKSAGDGEPQLGHIRDSGGIAQDAHTAIFVHNVAADNAEDERRTLFIRKNRYGKLGGIPMIFNGVKFCSPYEFNTETIKMKEEKINEYNRYTPDN